MKAQEVIQVLEENLFPFTEENIRAVIDVYPPGADDLVEEVLEEGVRRSMRALDAIWEALGSSPDDSVRKMAEEFLRREEGVELLCLPRCLLFPDGDEEEVEDEGAHPDEGEGEETLLGGDRAGEGARGVLKEELPDKKSPLEEEPTEEMVLEVRFVRELDGPKLESRYALLPASGPFRTLVAKIKPGLVEIGVGSNLYAANNRVFFEGRSLEDVEEAIKGVKALRPYFSHAGLADLGRALLALRGLEEGEARLEGSYLLARNERWFLRRGLVLGDPKLDRDLISGKPVTLSFPGDVELLLRASLERDMLQPWKLRLLEVGVWFKGESVRFGPHFPCADVLQDDPVFDVIQTRLEGELRSLERGIRSPLQASLNACSPRMLAFLKAFAKSEDLLRDLAEGRIQTRATAELFAEL